MPYMLTENIMMAAVARGGDRQELHEIIRVHSHAVTSALKSGAPKNDLLERLQNEKAFEGVDFSAIQSGSYLAGRSAEQVDDFIAAELNPALAKYAGKIQSGAIVER
jgi:adenylosuccinate lyase